MCVYSGTGPLLFHSHQTRVKTQTHNWNSNFFDYTSADLVGIFSPNQCAKKEEIKESDTDLDGGDCDVVGENSDPKDDVSLTAQ